MLVEKLDRLDNGTQTWPPDVTNTPSGYPPASVAPPGTPSTAPVILIRDVASEVGVRDTHPFALGSQASPDIISKGLIQRQEASILIELFVFGSRVFVC